MKLVHPEWENQVCIAENQTNIICIENPKAFYQYVLEFKNQCMGGEGRFVLSEKLKELPIDKKILFIPDLFNIEINEKQFQNKLFAKLKQIAAEEDLYFDTNKLSAEISMYIEKLMQKIEYPLIYESDIDLKDLFKISGVKFADESGSFVEKLLNYMIMVQELLDIHCFAFVNLKSCIIPEELIQLYKDTSYRKINLILFESIAREKLSDENIFIIDNDLCEIY